MAVIKLTKEIFENEVIKSDKPVLIDFSAVWCGPCRMVAPIVDEIAEENPRIKVCKVDVDEEPELAQAFGVSSIPMLVVVKNGKITASAVGARPKESIISLLGE
ncbi:MAG: thioredoxin [Acutalibacteraceae bacterium]